MNKLKALLNKIKAAVSTAAEFLTSNKKKLIAAAVLGALAFGGLDYLRAQAQAARDAGTAALKALTDSAGPLEGTYAIKFMAIQQTAVAKDVVIRLDGTLCYTLIASETRVCIMDMEPIAINRLTD